MRLTKKRLLHPLLLPPLPKIELPFLAFFPFRVLKFIYILEHKATFSLFKFNFSSFVFTNLH